MLIASRWKELSSITIYRLSIRISIRYFISKRFRNNSIRNLIFTRAFYHANKIHTMSAFLWQQIYISILSILCLPRQCKPTPIFTLFSIFRVDTFQCKCIRIQRKKVQENLIDRTPFIIFLHINF